MGNEPLLGLNELLPLNDSTLYVGFNLKSVISNNFPKLTAGVYLSGNLGSMKYLIEPAITSHNYRKVELGSDYHRNNVSGSFINAFIKAKYKDFVFYFWKDFLFLGQVTHKLYYSIRIVSSI